MKKILNGQNVPTIASLFVLLFLYGFAAQRYRGFASVGVFTNFFADNAFLGLAAIGLTFVILSGGIDLSVGSVIGLTAIVSAVLIEKRHVPVPVVLLMAPVFGAAFGAVQGYLIHRFDIAPFLVTLAGLFFCRGLAFWVSTEQVQVSSPTIDALSKVAIPLGSTNRLPFAAIVFILAALIAWLALSKTPFGRSVYAIGGAETSATLMGVPTGRNKVLIYMISGICSCVAGLVFLLYTSSGDPAAATGLELDAIAAVVVGGASLKGGFGQIGGTILGVLIFAVIQSGITFEGSLSSWWARIAVGALLLAFILLQKGVEKRMLAR